MSHSEKTRRAQCKLLSRGKPVPTPQMSPLSSRAVWGNYR